MKFRASDGTLLGTFGLGVVGPWALAFDGANMWASENYVNAATKL